MNVLFLGNSHTYYHRMPRMVEAMSAEMDGPAISTRASTGGGVDLAWHWNRSRSRSLVERGNWDFVVLQNRSGGPLEEPESMERYADLWVEEIRRVAARPVFYLTWASVDRPDTQDQITSVYRQIASKHDALLAPVGEAWRRVRSIDANLHLHDSDGRHAAPTGSWLAACVLTSVMTDAEPANCRGSLQQEGQTLIALDDSETATLQQAAREAITHERTLQQPPD